jgi:hypothetical protein
MILKMLIVIVQSLLSITSPAYLLEAPSLLTIVT